MSDCPFKLILIDNEPIFRLGLRTALEPFPDLQVVAEADTGVVALQILGRGANSEESINLVVLELGLSPSADAPLSGLQLCQQLKAQYPKLPIFILSQLQASPQLRAAKAMGVEGYSPKGTQLEVLVMAMRQVAVGQRYWTREIGSAEPPLTPQNVHLLAIFRHQLRQSGLRQIDATLTEVNAQLQNPLLSTLDWFFLAGRRRELRAARWLVSQLLPIKPSAEVQGLIDQDAILPPSPEPSGQQASAPLAVFNSQLSVRPQQATIFDVTLNKIQLGLQNLTNSPLEIEALRDDKKRELLTLTLQKLEEILEELRFCEVQPLQLRKKRSLILRDLWQAVTTDFFGRYSTLPVGNRELEIVDVLLQDELIVQSAILDKIPLVVELLSYLLFKQPLVIDHVSYSADTPEATERAEALLQNLLIQVANAVVQPLLNQFAEVEVIKKNFYDRNLISTREIARFRNNLSWKYRIEIYISEPKRIFESQYILLILTSLGIKKTSIYASRTQEIAQLRGIPLVVTLGLEIRDAISPRLRSAVAFLGRGIVYMLTQVIGRGIGLIVWGILQAISSTLQETRYGKKQ